jgi:hypothetical protein
MSREAPRSTWALPAEQDHAGMRARNKPGAADLETSRQAPETSRGKHARHRARLIANETQRLIGVHGENVNAKPGSARQRP